MRPKLYSAQTSISPGMFESPALETANSEDRDPARIIATHWPMLSRIARAHEFDPERRKDLLQDMALALLRALPGFRGEASLKVFVARVAENRGLAHATRAVLREGADELDEQTADLALGPEERSALGERVTRLFGAICQLPLALRQVSVLALEGFEAREVGEVLGITANTAAQRMKRARSALRAALEEDA